MAKRQEKHGSRLTRLGVIVHSSFDEFGFDVYQVRVCIHLCRRANQRGQCWPSIPSIASITGIGKRKVQQVLDQLVQLGFIKRQSRRTKDGGYTSDLITVSGLPLLPPGAPHAPGVAHHMHHPGAPRAPKGNPIEGNPIHTWDSIPKKAKSRSPSSLLESEVIPDALCPNDGAYTQETLSQAWSLTRDYYRRHSFSTSDKALGKCISCFAVAIQQRHDFASRLKLYFECIASLSPHELEKQSRLATIPGLNTTPWELVKHVSRPSQLLSAPPHTASQSAVVAQRNQRKKAAQAEAALEPLSSLVIPISQQENADV